MAFRHGRLVVSAVTVLVPVNCEWSLLANHRRTPLACVPRPTTPPDASQAGRALGRQAAWS
jgi:hypothetical protein